MLPSQRSALVSRASASIVFALVVATMVGCHPKGNPRPSRTAIDGATKQQVSHVEELLEGRPGVEVRRTDNGGYQVRVRGGGGSFMSSEEPLWVIDGVAVDLRGRGLSWLNPADVSRIEVLKNPQDIAVYGVRGANGVIVITTKKTKREG